MWERDPVEFLIEECCASHLAYDAFEARDFCLQHLLYGEASHRDHELWADDLDLVAHPRGAANDLFVVWNAVPATVLGFAWKAATHGGDVDLRAKLFFADADRREPLEEPLARGPSEWLSDHAFARARSLPDKVDLRFDSAAAHDGRDHVRTPAALKKRLAMNFKPS